MPPRDDVGIIDVTDTRAMDVLRSPVNGGVFEIMRRHRGGASVADLASATGLPKATVIGCVDALVGIGLARRVPARGRTPARFAATCDLIAIRADPFRADHVRAVRQHFKDATGDIEQALRDSEGRQERLPDGHVRLDARLKLDLRPEEWPEFRKRLWSALQFAANVAASRRAPRDGSAQTCDTVLSIRLAPCDPPLLPAPTIRVVGPAAAPERAEPGRRAGLTEREWQVASLVAGGRTRAEAARRLRVAESTAATLLRRAYRKLDVRSKSGLRLRLERAARCEQNG